MNKFTLIIVSILPLFGTFAISWFIYKNIPTTPVLILILLLIFLGVFVSLILFRTLNIKQANKEKLILIEDYPEVEEGLIYVIPKDFCNKVELNKGSLFIADLYDTPKELVLTKAEYKQLTDTVILTFKNLRLEITALTTIGVGDLQFCLFGFDDLKITKDNKLLATYSWKNDFLEVEQDGKARLLSIHDGGPTVLFSWEDSF
mgnify:CR=1 FL=1